MGGAFSFVSRRRDSKPPTHVVKESLPALQPEWGGMVVAQETFAAGTHQSPLFRGLPNDRCQCPHWGYVVRGRFRVRYADREEVVQAGEAYYLEPGHLIAYEEETEVVEFSPSEAHRETMAVVYRNLAASDRPQCDQATEKVADVYRDRLGGG